MLRFDGRGQAPTGGYRAGFLRRAREVTVLPAADVRFTQSNRVAKRVAQDFARIAVLSGRDLRVEVGREFFGERDVLDAYTPSLAALGC